MSLRKQTPSDFLKQIIGRPVVVKLNSGVDYRGVLACLDGYMNIALEQTEEYVNGQLKNKYGDAFIRGNNGNGPALGLAAPPESKHLSETCYEGLWFQFQLQRSLRSFSSDPII
ncbi:U6 snRNA-associated Sm-like protein LSm6 [Galemys pyrenaicus]|uniref:U6 snRNA-associated Sm-like protein LSm6 n=1 Tax=Galemys pyrenaicus TaxID=202257 RepID=A0A8J6DU49_GALPY|nr:U6 snRNA-associated Sm-like protein LSm6 [Galemys pyrenaicus]